MENTNKSIELPAGTRALILSKRYYGVLSKSLEKLETERYFSVLFYILNNNGCCCQQNICNSLAIDKTAMVKILDTLQKAGFIERKKNPHDRREHFISLSAKGKKEAKEITKAFARIDREMFADISEEEKNTFLKVLDQVSFNLYELPADDLFFNYKKTKK